MVVKGTMVVKGAKNNDSHAIYKHAVVESCLVHTDQDKCSSPLKLLFTKNSDKGMSCVKAADKDTQLSEPLSLNHSSSSHSIQAESHAINLSFQLIIRAEPVDLVLATIRALLAVKAINDEIVIIDNNHTQIELYQPLATFCADLDDHLNVHFYHIDAVAGFKSGALNLALGLMSPDCTHVVVVDSDYQALPQARASISAAINRYPDHALLQFPQFYRDTNRDDVHRELNHYFNHHLYRDFNRTRALSTGTYAVIRRRALLDIGGWSSESITEDAQMGVQLHRAGLRSRFVPEVIATGLLPNTLCDLTAQRQRWVYGNMQVLAGYFDSQTLSDSNTTQPMGERLHDLRAHLSQLSAWVNFTGIFILLHICTLLIVTVALIMSADSDMSMLLTPLYVVYAAYGLFVARRLRAYCCDESPLNRQIDDHHNNGINKKLRAWMMHLNFWEVGALSWLPVLWGRDKPFICTPKQQTERTRQTVWLANIKAVPMLLFILNITTAVMVSPLSPLSSPILFVCALVIVLLKLGSIAVAFKNYGYEHAVKSSKTKLCKEMASNRIKESLSATFGDEQVPNP